MNNNSEFMPVECLNVPKVLFYDKQYEDLSMDAKLIYTIYADNIDSISYYREHPLVLEAIQELRERFPDFKYFMTAQEKQDIYPECMTAEAIAYALVDLAEDFDTYEFRDNVDDKETLVKEIEYDLYAGRGKKEYAGFLKDVMDESDELSTKAQVLLQRINDYSIPEKRI